MTTFVAAVMFVGFMAWASFVINSFVTEMEKSNRLLKAILDGMSEMGSNLKQIEYEVKRR